jgi:hypothetical protein
MKKLNTKYILTLMLGASLFTVSCQKDLLSPVPQTSISDASSFSSATRVKSQLLSVYGALKGGNLYGGRFVIYGDIRGENFINESSNLVTGTDVWNQNPTNSATAVIGLWSQAYFTINAANLFIDGMATQTAVTGTTAANYVAEAKVVRALSYLTLLQYYARPYADGAGSKPGVPLRLTGIKGTGFSDLARSSVADVYKQIIADLDYAEANLPVSYTSAADNTTRAHRNTAIAIKTRVYMNMQNYAKVITEANKIVPAAAPFTATSGVAHALNASYTNIFTAYTSTESILSMPMSATSGDNPGTQNQLAYYFSPSSANGGVGNAEYSLNASGIIADAGWKSTDARRSFVRVAAGKSWLTKYAAPSPYIDYVPVIRYAEVLLNLAEAKVRSTNTVDAQAVDLLNAVRQRSDATTTFTTSGFANATALADAIMKERNIEFLGEGLRNNDLTRLLLTIPAKGSAPAKAAGDNGYIWPISANELALNKLMTDN